jgi:ketosteroid isomerase-like protein
MVTGWFSSLGADRDLVTFDGMRIEESGEMGVISAFARFAAVSEKGEELRFLQNRLTWVVQKKDGAWKIIHEHTSGPVDGSTMKVQLQR